MNQTNKPKLGIFHWTIISLFIVYLFLKFGVSYLSMIIIGSEHPLPVPGALMVMFMLLAVVGALAYVSTSDEKLREFVRPILELLRGKEEGGRIGIYSIVRIIVLAAFPLLVGWLVYSQVAPSIKTPTALRIQHPTFPSEYEKLQNPFRNADAQTWAKYIEEGRVLYQINCRPCHGTKTDGKGPMARGFRLKPADFTDTGTIATVVEAYSFWRIKEGGLGLPTEASPWDSSMPAWKDDLTDEEIWKIIMAEYDTAGVEPRKPGELE